MDVAIVGIGMHRFGRTPALSGLQQGAHAARLALADAGLDWRDIEFAYGGSTDSGNADALVNELGMTGLPFINVSNGCATGGSSLIAACASIEARQHDLGLVVGFDKHERGAFNADPADWGLDPWYGELGLMLTTQFFAMKITKYMHDYGITAGSLARVAEKAFRNGALNPNAWRRTPIGRDEILAAPLLNDPLTKYMFCSPGEGAVALVVCRADKAAQYADKPVYIRSAVLKSRRYGSFEVFAPSQALDQTDGPTVDAARAAFEQAGVGPGDIDIAQLQDTESGAEIMHMAENGFCEHGEQQALLAAGETGLGGRLPVNTDGGCIANGEPIGASGLRQVYENVLQLRGGAGERQVQTAPRLAYSHVYGAPGISAVAIVST
ncbi:MAG: thiolase family protein [Pseudomonadota bacterium]